MTRLLFVCLGNICRSPAAEGVMRARAPDMEMDSAGTGNWHVGEPPYGPMREAAQRRGVDLSGLRARQISTADFGAFDLILAMDSQNLADIEALRPAGDATPVLRFAGEKDVPDPYYTRDFEGCLDLIEDSADALIRRLDAMRR